MTEEEAIAWLHENVSRETFEALQTMVDSLVQWNRRINLVAPSTISHVWARHVVDSAQLFALAPKTATKWMDLGSGAGFPGMVLGIMLRERAGAEMVCVESNGKKAGFLANCARQTRAPVRVENKRIENLPDLSPRIITARALKPLDQLLAFCENLCTADTMLLFPKGKDSKLEVEAAQERWDFDCQSLPSLSGNDGRILRISNVRRSA